MAAAFLTLILIASPTLAQDRNPSQRQTLIDLAYVLGQSHALRQVCMGPDDQFWRDRMTSLVETETPDPQFDARLRGSFNSGFTTAQAQYPACGPDSRSAETRAAAHGRALAAALAR